MWGKGLSEYRPHQFMNAAVFCGALSTYKKFICNQTPIWWRNQFCWKLPFRKQDLQTFNIIVWWTQRLNRTFYLEIGLLGEQNDNCFTRSIDLKIERSRMIFQLSLSFLQIKSRWYLKENCPITFSPLVWDTATCKVYYIVS